MHALLLQGTTAVNSQHSGDTSVLFHTDAMPHCRNSTCSREAYVLQPSFPNWNSSSVLPHQHPNIHKAKPTLLTPATSKSTGRVNLVAGSMCCRDTAGDFQKITILHQSATFSAEYSSAQDHGGCPVSALLTAAAFPPISEPSVSGSKPCSTRAVSSAGS